MKIVIGVDRSQASKACFERVVARTWTQGTQLTLVAVKKPDPLALFDDSREEQARQLTLQSSAYFQQHGHGTVLGCEILQGDPAHVLIELARNRAADLIVVGANDRSVIQRMLLGSVSQAVLEHAPCPVLIIKDSGLDNEREFKNILVAVDGSFFTELALVWLCQQPWAADTQFHFLTVIPELPKEYSKPGMSVEEAVSLLENQARVKEVALDNLNQLLSPYAAALANWKFQLDVAAGAPAAAIVQTAREKDIDLIVTGSHGLSGFSRLVLGSVSSYVSAHAPCSVLVVKSAEAPVGQSQSSALDNVFPERSKHAGDNGGDYLPHVGFHG